MASSGEIESYVKKKDVEGMFKRILVACFKSRPDDPVEFLCAAARGANPPPAPRARARPLPARPPAARPPPARPPRARLLPFGTSLGPRPPGPRLLARPPARRVARGGGARGSAPPPPPRARGGLPPAGAGAAGPPPAFAPRPRAPPGGSPPPGSPSCAPGVVRSEPPARPVSIVPRPPPPPPPRARPVGPAGGDGGRRAGRGPARGEPPRSCAPGRRPGETARPGSMWGGLDGRRMSCGAGGRGVEGGGGEEGARMRRAGGVEVLVGPAARQDSAPPLCPGTAGSRGKPSGALGLTFPSSVAQAGLRHRALPGDGDAEGPQVPVCVR